MDHPSIPGQIDSRIHHRYWRILDWEASDPYRNLAVEEALFRMVEEGGSPNTIRFWRNPNTVVIGRFQSVGLEIDLEACRRYGTVIVRRLTGGGAVYQDLGNLNWTVVMERDHPHLPRDLTGIYRLFGEAISKGIGLLDRDLDIRFNPPNSISIDGLKISGMAASIRRRSLLCHGTLLIDADLERLRSLLKRAETSTPHSLGLGSRRYTRSRWVEVTNLSSALGRKISMEEVKERLLEAFQDILSPGETVKGNLSKREERLTEQLLQGKYRSLSWNLYY